MQIVKGLAVVFTCACAGWVLAGDDAPNPQEKLETAVPEAIRMLKAREYVPFLQAFIPPDDLKKLTAAGSFDAIAAQFGEKKAPRLLKALEGIATAKLTVDEEKQIATYTFPEPIDGKGGIRFQKVGKLWYLMN